MHRRLPPIPGVRVAFYDSVLWPHTGWRRAPGCWQPAFGALDATSGWIGAVRGMQARDQSQLRRGPPTFGAATRCSPSVPLCFVSMRRRRSRRSTKAIRCFCSASGQVRTPDAGRQAARTDAAVRCSRRPTPKRRTRPSASSAISRQERRRWDSLSSTTHVAARWRATATSISTRSRSTGWAGTCHPSSTRGGTVSFTAGRGVSPLQIAAAGTSSHRLRSFGRRRRLWRAARDRGAAPPPALHASWKLPPSTACRRRF